MKKTFLLTAIMTIAMVLESEKKRVIRTFDTAGEFLGDNMKRA